MATKSELKPNPANETPEQYWKRIKDNIFLEGVPEDIEGLIQRGFKESIDITEKWMRLEALLQSLKTIIS